MKSLCATSRTSETSSPTTSSKALTTTLATLTTAFLLVHLLATKCSISQPKIADNTLVHDRENHTLVSIQHDGRAPLWDLSPDLLTEDDRARAGAAAKWPICAAASFTFDLDSPGGAL